MTLSMISLISSSLSNPISTQIDSKSNEILGLDYEFAKIVIPVIVTLSVFLFGQLISWFKSKFEKVSELKSIKSTIENWIQFIEPTINSQIKGSNDFILKLEKSNELHPERYPIVSLLVDKLQQIKLQSLIDTIVLNLRGAENNKAQIVFSLVSQIEFLVKTEQKIKDNYKEFKDYAIELMEEWNKTFKEFNYEMNETARKIQLEEPNCSFNKQKNTICNSFSTPKVHKNFNEIFSELLVPMEEIVHQFLKNSENKYLAIELGYKIEQLKIIHYKWSVHKKGHIALANDHIESINKAYENLKSAASDLKKSKFKWLVFIK